MQHYRKGTNDYVMTTSTGQRELLYVEGYGRDGFLVLEQARHLVFDTQRTLKHNYKIRYALPARSLFEHSMQLIRASGCRVDTFTLGSVKVTRFQFRPLEVIKWAPYNFEDGVYFMPYAVRQASMSDILILQKNRKVHREIAVKQDISTAINELNKESK